jgi:pentatricopeptide repeat protein
MFWKVSTSRVLDCAVARTTSVIKHCQAAQVPTELLLSSWSRFFSSNINTKSDSNSSISRQKSKKPSVRAKKEHQNPQQQKDSLSTTIGGNSNKQNPSTNSKSASGAGSHLHYTSELFPVRLEDSKQTARELLQKPLWDELVDFERAKNTLMSLRQPNVDLFAITLAFSLIPRYLAEANARCVRKDPNWKEQDRTAWMTHHAKFMNPFFTNYKLAALQGVRGLPTPQDVLEQINDLSNAFAWPQQLIIDKCIYGDLLDVVLRQNPSDKQSAPKHGEEFLAQLASYSKRHPKMKPNIFQYTRIMQAWAVSGHAKAGQKLLSLFEKMRDPNKTKIPSPNIVAYNVMLRFFGTIGHVQKIQQIFSWLEQDQIQPDIISYAQALYGYGKAGRLEDAEDCLNRMLAVKIWNECTEREIQVIRNATKTFIFCCRKLILYPHIDPNRKQYVLSRAEHLYELMKVQYGEQHHLHNAMSDVYQQFGDAARASECRQRAKLDRVQFFTAEFQEPHKGRRVVKRILNRQELMEEMRNQL